MVQRPGSQRKTLDVLMFKGNLLTCNFFRPRSNTDQSSFRGSVSNRTWVSNSIFSSVLHAQQATSCRDLKSVQEFDVAGPSSFQNNVCLHEDSTSRACVAAGCMQRGFDARAQRFMSRLHRPHEASLTCQQCFVRDGMAWNRAPCHVKRYTCRDSDSARQKQISPQFLFT